MSYFSPGNIPPGGSAARFRVSVCIVNTNTRDLLIDCIQSIYDTVEKDTYEIIVVDNASTDGSVETIRSNFPDVTLIENEFNNWFTGATNQAIHVSNGEYILCLNPDTVCKPGAIDRLIAFLDEHPDVGMVGPRLLNGDGSLQPSCRNFLTNRRLVLQHIIPWRHMPNTWRRHAVLEYWNHDAPLQVDWIIGACILVRRTAMEQVGLKDEGYPIFHEETDWCYRFMKAGWTTWFFPDAEVIHYGSQTVSKLWGRGLVLEFYKGKHRFIRTHYGPASLVLHRILLSGLLLARLMRTVLLDAVSHGDEYREQQHIIRRALALQLGLE